MNLGKLDEKCPKCGCKDKTLKRDIESENYAHAKTEHFYVVNVDMYLKT